MNGFFMAQVFNLIYTEYSIDIKTYLKFYEVLMI